MQLSLLRAVCCCWREVHMHCCLDCQLERHVELDAGPSGLCKAVYRIVLSEGAVRMPCSQCYAEKLASQSDTQAMLVAANAVDRALCVPEQSMHMHPVSDVCVRSSADSASTYVCIHQYCDAQLPQQFAVPCACHSPDATHLERFGFIAREARRRPTARAVESFI